MNKKNNVTVKETQTNKGLTFSYAKPEYVVYPTRWVVLFIFAVYSASSSMHVTQYTIIQDAVVKYHGVSNNIVYWTNMIFMATYVVLIVPASWLINKVGLRVSTIVGSFGTCLGAWLKVFSVAQDRFWMGFLGQTIVAVFQLFVFSLPPRVAAVWFGPDQVSVACSIGVVGYQLGIAIGFVLPPIIVHTESPIDELGSEFKLLFYIVAGFNTVLLVVVLIFFKAAPATPPSAVAKLGWTMKSNFFQSTKNLFTNRNYVLHLIAYGINIGVYFAITTVFNVIILEYYPTANEDAGRIGLVLVVSGLVGSVVCGVILDKTHKFKETAVTVYISTVVSMLIFTFTLDCGYIGVIYLTNAVLGFSMLGHIAVGLELAAELTFPEPEVTTMGILNAAAQGFGVALTLLYERLFDSIGDLWTNITFSALLGVGAVLTALVQPDLRRQRVRGKHDYGFDAVTSHPT